jgi:YVTN family beta-propeller protein
LAREVKRLLPLLLAAACASGTLTSRSTPTASPTPKAEGTVVEVGNRPCGVLSAAGSVWVSTYTDDQVVRLDPTSHAVLAHAKTGGSPCGMAFGAGSVWVEDYTGNAVTRVDATTGKAQRDYPVGQQPYDVAFAGGAAWATDYLDGTLTRIDAATGTTSKVQISGTPIGIAPSHGLLWVANGSTRVTKVDPATGKVVGTVEVGLATTWTAYDDTHLWVSDTAGGLVVVLDTVTSRVVATAKTGGRPADGSVADGVAWFPDRADGTVVGVDATGKLVGRHRTGLGDPFVLDSVGSTLWVGDFGGTTVSVLPLR